MDRTINVFLFYFNHRKQNILAHTKVPDNFELLDSTENGLYAKVKAVTKGRAKVSYLIWRNIYRTVKLS